MAEPHPADPAGAAAPPARVSRAPALAAALDAFFDWYYAAWPVNATFIGVHAHDRRLPDLSETGLDEAQAAVESLRARFRALPPEPMTEAEAMDRRLVEGFLEIQAWEYGAAHGPRGNPCLYTGEAVFGVMSLFLRPFAPFAERAEAAVARLRAVPALLAQGEAVLRAAPRAWTERALRECRGALAFFEGGLRTLLEDEGPGAAPRADGPPALDVRELLEAGRAAAAAVRRFAHVLQERVVPRDGGYACGTEALARIVRAAHALAPDLEAVVALGAARLGEAEAALHAAAARLGLRSWQAGLDAAADRHPSPEHYYVRYAEVWEAARQAADAHALVTWPDYPIRYVPQPRWAREAAPWLYFLPYRAPSAFDRVPVVDYLVTPVEPEMPPDEQRRRLRAANDAVITLNHVVHHGGLGHHVQNWYAYHRAESRVGRIAAVDCASRIAMLCGGTMAEGWACYATDLMEEVGFLDPLTRLVQAQSRARIAARAVADVRLHRGKWTLEETAAWYRDRAGMGEEAARAEVVKNSLFPGAALMYLVGVEAIHELRRELSRRPGFSLRVFHDRLLAHGSVPVALAAAAMRASPALRSGDRQDEREGVAGDDAR